MRKMMIILIAILIVACEKIPSEKENVNTVTECLRDNGCVAGGCSGTICQSKDAETVYTTCEFLPEYACYRNIKCRCIEGKCQWDKTEEFDICIKEKRNS